MGLMFAWATREYLLNNMSLDQIIYYYNEGWEAKQTEAKVHWGTYGAMMSESAPETHGPIKSRPGIEEIRETYPGYENAYYDENGRLVRG
jgi:hypothetical protein